MNISIIKILFSVIFCLLFVVTGSWIIQEKNITVTLTGIIFIILGSIFLLIIWDD